MPGRSSAGVQERVPRMIGRMFLGRYEAQRVLGEGGMGKVYLARQTDLGRIVVVKVMHDHIAADPKFRDRFERETRVMARFLHPNAVTLFDASLTDPNGPCIVMEYVKGVNLESLLAKNGRLTAARVGRVVTQLCDVLQAAHDEGIIHRDLKPANLMICDPDSPRERVKVMDFGLAKLIEENSNRRVTDTNIDFAVGTPGYICPEQVRGETMDHRGDLYSVGIMLYELMAGRLPFVGATSMDVLLAHATEAPPPFADLNLEGLIPKKVEEVVRCCLEKDPDDRPQSARELSDRFLAALGRPVSRPDISVGKPAVRGDSALATRPAIELEGQAAVGLAPHPEPEVVALSQSETVSRAPSRTPVIAPLAAAAPGTSATTLSFQMEAWMPESVALMKLRGFVQDTDGAVLESGPGLVRVRFGKSTGVSGAFSWLGFARRHDPVNVDLHLLKIDPNKENRLGIYIHFRPSHPSLLSDSVWRERCTQLFVELRGYLMGGV
jgi:serine/threonine-protein kinase